MTDEIVVRGFSLTRFEMAVIEKVSQRRKLFNGSAALRQIIGEWAEWDEERERIRITQAGREALTDEKAPSNESA